MLAPATWVRPQNSVGNYSFASQSFFIGVIGEPPILMVSVAMPGPANAANNHAYFSHINENSDARKTITNVNGEPVSATTKIFDYEACLHACARQSKEALQELYLEEGGRLMGVVSRIVKDRATAEDLIHDVFLKIWQKAHMFDASRGNARSWIYAIGRNLALDSIRFSKRQGIQTDAVDEISDASDSSWHEQINSTHWGSLGNNRVQDCIMALEPERRSCIYHAYVNGYTQSEIGDLLGAPLGSVKSWIKRSLLSLRECLG